MPYLKTMNLLNSSNVNKKTQLQIPPSYLNIIPLTILLPKQTQIYATISFIANSTPKHHLISDPFWLHTHICSHKPNVETNSSVRKYRTIYHCLKKSLNHPSTFC